MASGQPVKGVNLGGWLVLEPWMTPSLFIGTGAIDEYIFCQRADKARLQRLKQFRDTFITEQDFIWLAEQGVQAVRLPVGYWLFGKQGSYTKTCQYVDMVFEWAKTYNLQVLLSLHGAPGSQNGKMHSGQAGAACWSEVDKVSKTLNVLEKIAERYGTQPALLGISLLNEPLSTTSTQLLVKFYSEAERRMRPHCKPATWLIISDNFKPHRWRKQLNQFPMDHHHYQLFRWFDKYLPISAQLLRTRWLLPHTLKRYQKHHPLIIGEWSIVLKDSPPLSRNITYGRRQLRAFTGHCNAWFYWSYKTERGGLWSFRDCIEKGLLHID